MNKNKIKLYIEKAKKINFSAGSSDDLVLLEDIIRNLEKYLEDRLSEEDLLIELDCMCPRSDIIEFEEFCSPEYSDVKEEVRCIECWKNVLS